MAVSTTDTYSGPYQANGVTVEFPFTFKAVSVDDVGVFIRDGSGNDILVSEDAYSVSLSVEGGAVIMAIAPASGELYIFSEPSFLQPVKFASGQPFLPDVVNEVNDRDVVRALYLKREIDRAPKTPIGGGQAGKFPVVAVGGGWGFASGTGNDPALRADLADPDLGAILLNYRNRTAKEKLDEVPSVRDFGAVQDDGTTPQQNYFSAAAQEAQARVTTTPAFAAMPQAPTGEVRVPDGLYHLTDDVDSGGKDITWNCSDGARFTTGSASHLLGKVVRRGRTSMGSPIGYLDSACPDSVMAGEGSADNSPLVSGFTAQNQISTYDTIDIVGRYTDVTGRTLVHDSVAAFTATTCVLATPAPVKKLRRGMPIQTTHDPWYRGQILSWSEDGTVITVTGWFPKGSTVGATPSNVGSPHARFAPFDKIWAKNSNFFVIEGAYTYQAAGHEIGCWNGKVAPAAAEDSAGQTWGNDAVNLGPLRCAIGHMTRGDFWEGFRATGTVFGYNAAAFSRLGYAAPTVGYNYDGAGVAFQQRSASGAIQFQVSGGGIELGDRTVTSSPFIDFHSSGAVSGDYDARIIATGGGGTNGNGGLRIAAAETVTSLLKPSADNLFTLGASGYRWSVVWAATGTISTSDPRLKRFISDADMWAAVKRAVLSIDIQPFQWLDAIAAKGEDEARIHIGVNAQEVIDAFAAEGLDARRYALFCEDPEIETVTIVTPVEVPDTESVEEEQTVPEVVGDGIVLRKKMVEVEKPKTQRLRVFNEDGSPHMRPKYAPPLFPDLPGARPILVGFEQAYSDVPVMKTKDVVTYEERPTGMMRLGIRYEQLAMLMIAALRT